LLAVPLSAGVASMACSNPEKAGVPTPKPSASPTPEIIIPSLNSETSGKSWVIQKDTVRPALISGNTVFYNDKDGYAIAMEAKTRKQLWKSPETCVLAAADESRVITIDNQSNIILRAANNFREVKKIPPPIPNLPQERLKNLYPGGLVLTSTSLIVPHKETIMGTKDGFSVYGKQTGEKLWGSDSKDHFDFLEAVDGKVIAGSEGFIYMLDEKSGEELGKLPASKSNRWVWEIHDNILVTVKNSEPDQYKAIESSVYIWDLGQSKQVTTVQLRSGYYDQTLDRQITTCLDFCKGLDTVHIFSHPPSYGSSPDSKGYIILAEVPLGSKPPSGSYGHFFMFLDYTPPRYSMSEVENFTVVSSRTVFSTKEDIGVLIYTDSSFTTFPYLERPTREGSLPLRKEASVYRWEPLTTFTTYTELVNVPLLELVDKINNIVIATSCNKKLGVQADGSLKIFGLAPEKNRSSYVWVWDSGRRDPLEIIPFPEDNSLIVIGESIIKIDATTGKQTQLVGFTGAPPKHVRYKEGSIYVETNDGRLFAFHF